MLRVNGLDDFDTLRLLEMTEGRNSQGDCYLVPLRVQGYPKWFREREQHRIVEVVVLEGRRLIVATRSGGVRYHGTDDVLSLNPALARVANEESSFEHAQVMLGGKGVRWG